MLKVVAFVDENLIVQDTDDCSFENISEKDGKLLLSYGVSVGGLSIANDGTLVVSDEFFLQLPSEDDEDDDLDEYLFEDDSDEDLEENYDDDEDFDDLEDDSEDDSDEEFEDDSDEDFEEEEYEDELEEDYEDEEDYDDYDDYFDDDEDDENASIVAMLYAKLTPEQIMVLKRYYLWYSQRIFSEAQKDPTLSMHSQAALMRKRADLNTLRNTGGLWHYAGFIDLGRKGEGYCTLGHPLRYMHLAWDVSVSDIESAFFGDSYNQDFEDAIESNNCIIFGIKCIADFFEVSKDCVRDLQRAQREALRDMGTIYTYYEDNRVDEVNKSFECMDEIVKLIGKEDAKGKMLVKDYKPIISSGIYNFYSQFRQSGITPPKSLIQELRDNIVGWASHNWIYDSHAGSITNQLHLMSGNRQAQIMGILAKKESKKLCTSLSGFNFDNSYVKTTLSLIYAYIHCYLAIKSCGIYAYNGVENKDEGGSNKLYLRIFRDFESSASRIFVNAEFSLDYLKKLADLYDVASSYIGRRDDRLKTPVLQMVDSTEMAIDYTTFVYNSDYADEYSIKNKVEFSNAVEFFNRFHTRRHNGYGKAIEDYTNEALESKKILDENIAGYQSFVEDKLKEKVEKSKERKRQIEQERIEREERERAKELEKKEQESKASNVTSMQDVIDYLNNNDLSGASDSNSKFAKNVLETVNRSGKLPSSKQFYYLKMLYEKVSGQTCNVDDGKKLLSDDAELEKALKYLVDHKDLVEDTKTYDIICSIVKYGKISERQMKYAEEGKRIFDSLKKE